MQEVEYQAMRQFLKMLDNPDRPAGPVFDAVAEELTPRQSEMVRLYFIKQMPMREIASTLGVNVSTVSRTISRGKRRLHRALRYGQHRLLDTTDPY